ncbi:hypothetical protein ACF0H5_003438 [Mactra antiquata]
MKDTILDTSHLEVLHVGGITRSLLMDQTSGFTLVSVRASQFAGFTNVLGESVTIMGMLMTAMSILLFMAAIRLFLISAKLRKAERTLQISRGTVASMVIEREDERGTLTVVMDAVNIETRCRRRSNDSNRPPDYEEATSDYYPEGTSEVVIDSLSGDPPPPYGPPTYDQAMSESKTDLHCKVNMNDSEDMCSNVPGTSYEHNEHELMEHSEQCEEPEILHEYQDLPAVTI